MPSLTDEDIRQLFASDTPDLSEDEYDSSTPTKKPSYYKRYIVSLSFHRLTDSYSALAHTDIKTLYKQSNGSTTMSIAQDVTVLVSWNERVLSVTGRRSSRASEGQS